MPRPDDITSEELADWTASHEESLKEEDPNALRPTKLDVWLGGCYLKQKLLALDCPEARAMRICFACGQRQSMADDPWIPVFRAIADYKQGKWEEPGDELGTKIFQERFGSNPDPKAVLKWLKDSGIDEVKLRQMMFRMLVEGREAVMPELPPPE